MNILGKLNKLFGNGFITHQDINGGEPPEGYRPRTLKELKAMTLKDMRYMTLFDIAYVRVEEIKQLEDL